MNKTRRALALIVLGLSLTGCGNFGALSGSENVRDAVILGTLLTIETGNERTAERIVEYVGWARTVMDLNQSIAAGELADLLRARLAEDPDVPASRQYAGQMLIARIERRIGDAGASVAGQLVELSEVLTWVEFAVGMARPR